MEFKRDIGGRDLGNLGFPIGNYISPKLGVPDKRVSIYFRASKYKPYQKRKGRKQPTIKTQPLDKNILAFINLQKMGQANLNEIISGNYNAINSQIMALNQNQQIQNAQMKEQQRELLNQIDILNKQAMENNQKITQLSPEIAQQRDLLTQQRIEILQGNQQLKNQLDEQMKELNEVQQQQMAQFNRDSQIILQEQSSVRDDIKREMQRLATESAEFQEDLKRTSDERIKNEIQKNLEANKNLIGALNRNIEDLQRETGLKLGALKSDSDLKSEQTNDQIKEILKMQRSAEAQSRNQFERVNIGLEGIDKQIRAINPELQRTLEDTRQQISDRLQQLDTLRDMQKQSDEIQQKNIVELKSNILTLNEDIKERNKQVLEQMMRGNKQFKSELEGIKKQIPQTKPIKQLAEQTQTETIEQMPVEVQTETIEQMPVEVQTEKVEEEKPYISGVARAKIEEQQLIIETNIQFLEDKKIKESRKRQKNKIQNEITYQKNLLEKLKKGKPFPRLKKLYVESVQSESGAEKRREMMAGP